MDLVAYMKERASKVDAALDAWLPPADRAPAAIHAAMRHLVFPGGKRLRPVLACAGAEALGAPGERAMPAAIAVELIHIYSLVHDDLPCMDDDDERRGRPTVHVVYGEATAVLAGDGLLASAFECLSRASGYDSASLLGAVGDLSHAAGSLQLVGGQVDDLAVGERSPDAEEIEGIHLRKTAALMSAAVVSGARLAGGGDDDLARFQQFGLRLGVAFQIADDLLDAEDDEPCSSVRALGEEGARTRAAELIREAEECLEPYGEKGRRAADPCPLRDWPRSMSATLLENIESPEDLRVLPADRVPDLVVELRDEIVRRVSKTGGHLASSLGAVELITGLHYTFDTPRDRIVLDVGHQGYAHKMLTGRREGFDAIGKDGGIGKFLRRHESAYDHFGAGHAGTSVSAALGIARAKQHRGDPSCGIALIGDGGMTAGMALEALNHAGELKQRNLLVVLNDNEMSIAPNVGAMSSFLSRKWSAPLTRRLKHYVRDVLEALPGDMVHWAHKAEESFKAFISPSLLFEALGFRYLGPIHGNSIGEVLETFGNARRMLDDGDGPVLVHAVTAKGFGYGPAEADPFRYHGVTPFEVESGEMAKKKGGGAPSYTRVFSDALIELAGEDERVVGITAAMPDGTGLDRFQAVHPDRYYDVGIAEQHAVTFAAGLATEGMKPVAAIYSTFLQRAFDQVVHDVCVQNLDVTFALDRAGLVGADGATHQGLYDVAYLRMLPNMVVMAPKDENELRHMLKTAVLHPGPAALRFPRGNGVGVPLEAEIKALPIGEAELLRDGDAVAVLAFGHVVHPALEAAELLAAEGISAAVLNARFAKPLDAERIGALARRCQRVVTVEEGSALGGFGAAVMELLARLGIRAAVQSVAIPDRIVEHGNADEIRAEMGLDAAGIATAARQLTRRS